MTKSTSKKVKCVSCGETYFARKPHVCDMATVEKKKGSSHARPQQVKSNKMMFGRKR